MSTYETVLVERSDPHIARIVMNRPAARNAQNLQMTYDLNAALDAAALDDTVKVIIVAGSGPHFSGGHDLRATTKNQAGEDFPPIGNWGGFREPEAHGRFAREQEIYLQMTRRWRNLAKPTIAEVQGKCFAGGLMIAWACDMIVAADDAEFCDPVVTLGVCGVEWFVHPFELGPRKAKELLFTAGRMERERGASSRHGQSGGASGGVVRLYVGDGEAHCIQASVRAEDDERSRQPCDGRNRPTDSDRSGIWPASIVSCLQHATVWNCGGPRRAASIVPRHGQESLSDGSHPLRRTTPAAR